MGNGFAAFLAPVDTLSVELEDGLEPRSHVVEERSIPAEFPIGILTVVVLGKTETQEPNDLEIALLQSEIDEWLYRDQPIGANIIARVARRKPDFQTATQQYAFVFEDEARAV